jgi:hypothetical protein
MTASVLLALCGIDADHHIVIHDVASSSRWTGLARRGNATTGSADLS